MRASRWEKSGSRLGFGLAVGIAFTACSSSRSVLRIVVSVSVMTYG